MPSRKKSHLSPISRAAKKLKKHRTQETFEERQTRLEAARNRSTMARSLETASQREARLKYVRERCKETRARETASERRSRLKADRERQALRRGSETSMERELRLRADRKRHAIARALETSAERTARLKADKERHALTRALKAQNSDKDIKPKEGSLLRVHERQNMVVRVYNYFETEYKMHDRQYGSVQELTPLAHILRRTADATRLKERTVKNILEKVSQRKSMAEIRSEEDRQKEDRIGELVKYEPREILSRSMEFEYNCLNDGCTRLVKETVCEDKYKAKVKLEETWAQEFCNGSTIKLKDIDTESSIESDIETTVESDIELLLETDIEIPDITPNIDDPLAIPPGIRVKIEVTVETSDNTVDTKGDLGYEQSVTEDLRIKKESLGYALGVTENQGIKDLGYNQRVTRHQGVSDLGYDQKVTEGVHIKKESLDYEQGVREHQDIKDQSYDQRVTGHQIMKDLGYKQKVTGHHDIKDPGYEKKVTEHQGIRDMGYEQKVTKYQGIKEEPLEYEERVTDHQNESEPASFNDNQYCEVSPMTLRITTNHHSPVNLTLDEVHPEPQDDKISSWIPDIVKVESVLNGESREDTASDIPWRFH